MQIKIYNEVLNKEVSLSVSPSSILEEIFHIICKTEPDLKKRQCFFKLKDNVLKFDQTIQDLLVFYDLDQGLKLVEILLDGSQKNSFSPSDSMADIWELAQKQQAKEEEKEESEEDSKGLLLTQKRRKLPSLPLEQLPHIDDIWIETDKEVLAIKQKKWHLGLLDSVSDFVKKPQNGKIFAQKFQIINIIEQHYHRCICKALDLENQRIVLLKIMPTTTVVQREYGKFDHPYILNVYEIATTGPYTYITLEYLQGKPLSSFLRGVELGLVDLVEIMVKVAKALAYLHQNNYLHRYLSLENIWINQELTPQIYPGISYNLKTPIFPIPTLETYPKMGELKSCAICVSPEEVTKQSTSASSDIFSFGALFYQLITRTPPFGYHKFAFWLNSLVPPEKIDSHISETLSSLIVKMLALDSSKRWQSVEEFLPQLEKWWQLSRLNSFVEYINANGFMPSTWGYYAPLLVYREPKFYEEIAPTIEKHLTTASFVDKQCWEFIQEFGDGTDLKTLTEYFTSIADKTIQKTWLKKVALQIPLEKELLSKLSLDEWLAIAKVANEKTRARLFLALSNYSTPKLFVWLFSLSPENKNFVFPIVLEILKENRQHLVGPLIITLWDSHRQKSELAKEILCQFGYEDLTKALLQVTSEEDLWFESFSSVDEESQLSIIAALTLLLTDEHRNTCWLAGKALSMLSSVTAVQKYLQYLQKRREIYQVLHLANLGGKEIAEMAVRSLTSFIEESFLKAIWNLKWSSNLEARLQAAQLLGERRSARSVIFLVETLCETESQLRKAAADALTQIGTPVIFELVRHLNDPDIQEAIEKILRNIGWAAVPSLVTSLEKSQDVPRRAMLGKILGRIGGQEAICALLPLLGEKNENIQAVAKEGLVHQGKESEDWIKPALKGFQNVRLITQEILAKIGSKGIANVLFEDIRSTNIELRDKVVNIINNMDPDLVDFQGQSPKELLQAIVFVNNPVIRKKALAILELEQHELGKLIEQLHWENNIEGIEILKEFKDPFVNSALIYALEKDNTAAKKVATVLVELKVAKAAEALVQKWLKLWHQRFVDLLWAGWLDIFTVIDVEDTEDIKHYKKCIQELQNASLKPLQMALRREIPFIATRVLEVIEGIDTQEAVNLLREILKDECIDSFVKKSAYIALAQRIKATDILLQVLQKENFGYFRKKTILNLANERNAEVAKILQVQLKDQDPLVRQTAAQVLCSFGKFPFVGKALLELLFDSVAKVQLQAASSLGNFDNAKILNGLKEALDKISPENTELISAIKDSIRKIWNELAKKDTLKWDP